MRSKLILFLVLLILGMFVLPILLVYGDTPWEALLALSTPTPSEQATVVPPSLEFGDLTANEARFNPNAENPRALIMMFSLTFTNVSGERLEVRSPRLTLTVNGVPWTDLASTDFQIGRLQVGASQTIELQSLILQRKLTDEQRPIWQAILNGEPVDLYVSGTFLVFPGGQEYTIAVEKTLEDVSLPTEWGQP